jgi:glycosyltransferase involved in cell wall biosynthesis
MLHSAATVIAAPVNRPSTPTPPLRQLVLVEAFRLTGVARNILEFSKLLNTGASDVALQTTYVLVRREQETRRDDVAQAAREVGVPCLTLRERHRYDRAVVSQLQTIIRLADPDIVESHHVKSHCLMAMTGAWRSRTWVAFHHGYTTTDLKVRLYNSVDRWSLRKATHVVTMNEPFAHMLERRGVNRARITVLHNATRPMPVIPAAVGTLRHELGIGDAERVVLSVGRLSHEKGHADLLRAAAALPRATRVVIVGEGPERQRLESLAARLGMCDRVIFTGHRLQLAPFYAMADVFVLPSLSEGCPNALLEAMAAGLPIVATTVGGVPEVVADGVHALLVGPRDPAMLASALSMLLTNRRLARELGDGARKNVLRRHTPEQRAMTLTRLYAALCGSMTTAAPAMVS